MDNVDGDRVTEIVLLLQLGPARAYVSFVETTDLEDEPSGTEEESEDVEGG